MITDAEVLDTIPQEGAERAAALWAFRNREQPTVGAARAILEFCVWMAEQSFEMRMSIMMDIGRVVGKLSKEKRSTANGVS